LFLQSHFSRPRGQGPGEGTTASLDRALGPPPKPSWPPTRGLEGRDDYIRTIIGQDKSTERNRAANITVKVDPPDWPNGRFARLHDPEGDPIERWQPAGRDAPSL
jgi:hypothetical protein